MATTLGTVVYLVTWVHCSFGSFFVQLPTVEQDVEQFSQDNAISAVHRSKSDVDQKRFVRLFLSLGFVRSQGLSVLWFCSVETVKQID